MCAPSKRERRFGPFTIGKQLMRFLNLRAKMSVSRKRNERFEKSTSENRKCQTKNKDLNQKQEQNMKM
jgi:hypothetical protein